MDFEMKFARRFWIVAAVAALAISLAQFSDAARPQQAKPAQTPAKAPTFNLSYYPIPAYHATPPKGRLRPTLSPRDFPNDPEAQRAYAVAAKMKATLYQLPCYCHCDKEMGHTCLLSCYQDKHASECGTCKMELFYAWQQKKKGKTAAQIRAGIIRGEWQKVDMSKWNAPPPQGK